VINKPAKIVGSNETDNSCVGRRALNAVQLNVSQSRAWDKVLEICRPTVIFGDRLHPNSFQFPRERKIGRWQRLC